MNYHRVHYNTQLNRQCSPYLLYWSFSLYTKIRLAVSYALI